MCAVVVSLDGTETVEGKREGIVRNGEEAEAFGSKMAEELVSGVWGGGRGEERIDKKANYWVKAKG
jgi:hypothetical protein